MRERTGWRIVGIAEEAAQVGVIGFELTTTSSQRLCYSSNEDSGCPDNWFDGASVADRI